MATVTRNLFHGFGEGLHHLQVVEGTWPDDADGAVVIVGPDKRSPGGHWFDEPGLLCRIDLRPDVRGRITVRHRRLRTRVLKLRERLPRLFLNLGVAELSPFGVTNLANTNVEPIAGRLFVGYDAGRPIEVHPVTLETLTPVGDTGRWHQAMPGLLEPMTMVAAHPAVDEDRRVLWFLNSHPLPTTGEPLAFVARWDLDGPVRRWPVSGLEPFEAIHDIKASRNHLVFTDLPFAVGPDTLGFGERTEPNRDHTTIAIVAKADLDRTAPGRPVRATTVRVPFPTGHLTVDEDDDDGTLVLHLEHIPLADLTLPLQEGEPVHGRGSSVDADHAGLIPLGVQPGVVGTYRVDVASGRIESSRVAWDDRFWGPVLTTRDRWSPAARERHRSLWFTGIGFDPELVTEAWWRLYGESGLAAVVDPSDLPDEPIPASLVRFDLESGDVVDRWTFEAGTFASPPQFVPRRDATGPDDGHLVTILHRDGDKEIWIFDAGDLAAGPVARATTAGFRPPLLLHSTWVDEAAGRQRPAYRVGLAADLWGAAKALPGHLWRLIDTARATRDEQKTARSTATTTSTDRRATR